MFVFPQTDLNEGDDLEEDGLGRQEGGRHRRRLGESKHDSCVDAMSSSCPTAEFTDPVTHHQDSLTVLTFDLLHSQCSASIIQMMRLVYFGLMYHGDVLQAPEGSF